MASATASKLISDDQRLLRQLGFVVGQREGRRVVYDLHDDHVARLLDEAISHVEQLQLGLPGRTALHHKAGVTR